MPRKTAEIRAICERRSKRSSRSPAQSTATSETLGLYGRALMLAGRHDEAEAIFRQASQRFPTDPEVLPALRVGRAAARPSRRRAAGAGAVLGPGRRRSRRGRARGAHRRPVDAAERRNSGRRVVSAIGCAPHRAMRPCSPGWRTRNGARVRPRTRWRRSSVRSRKIRTIRSCARSRAGFRRDSASDRARRANRLREN